MKKLIILLVLVTLSATISAKDRPQKRKWESLEKYHVRLQKHYVMVQKKGKSKDLHANHLRIKKEYEKAQKKRIRKQKRRS